MNINDNIKMEKIDHLDRKILSNLDQNSRQSASSIAKKCRAHKNVVNFRINRLVENGIIRQFVAMISPSALGLTPYKIYLQLQNLTSKKEEHIQQLIKSFPVYWAAHTSGQWDFIIGVLVKDSQELSTINKTILNELGEDIIKKSVFLLTEAPHYYRKYLLNQKDFAVKYWIKNQPKQKVDEYDIKIMKILATNCRTNVVNIAKNVNLSVKTCMTRIKKLEKNGVIYDYRISLNLGKIGYMYFKCFIALKKAEKNRLKEFFAYCQSNPNIIHLIECVGEWELEPEFEIESFEKFQDNLSEIRNKFSDIIKSVETINILKEYSYICIPLTESRNSY